MPVSIVEFPAAGAPHPFEHGEHQWFIRREQDGAVSRLFAAGEVEDLNRLARSFPVGQTRLWVLERALLMDRRRAPPTIERWPLSSPQGGRGGYVILGDDGSALGSPEQASEPLFPTIAAAEAAIDSLGLAGASLLVIAWLRESIYWH